MSGVKIEIMSVELFPLSLSRMANYQPRENIMFDKILIPTTIHFPRFLKLFYQDKY